MFGIQMRPLVYFALLWSIYLLKFHRSFFLLSPGGIIYVSANYFSLGKQSFGICHVSCDTNTKKTPQPQIHFWLKKSNTKCPHSTQLKTAGNSQKFYFPCSLSSTSTTRLLHILGIFHLCCTRSPSRLTRQTIQPVEFCSFPLEKNVTSILTA